MVSTELEESHTTGTRSRHVDIDVDDDDDDGGGGKSDPADDYILLDDSESEAAEKESEDLQPRWTPYWKKVKTAMVIEAPTDVEIK